MKTYAKEYCFRQHLQKEACDMDSIGGHGQKYEVQGPCRRKSFLFVERVSPKGNNLGRRMKKDVKKRTVFTEVFTELLWNSEDNVTVFAFK